MVRRRSPAHPGAPFDFSRRHHWGLRSATALEAWASPGTLWERGPEPTARQVLPPGVHDSESDLLFSVEREPAAAPVLLYVLLEHQSSPDRRIRLRVLNYCVQVWERWRQTHKDERRLPLIVPLVLYHGAQPWQHEREFAELFTDAVPQWRWVPRFEHLLVDLWSTCWPRSPTSTVRCSSMRCGVTYRVAGET